jgi:hypothetical protein
MNAQQKDFNVLLNHGHGNDHGNGNSVWRRPGQGPGHNHEHRHDSGWETGLAQRPSGRNGGGANPPGGQSGSNSQQERYVTSAGIESVRKKIDTDAKQFFADVKGYVDDTDVSFPGWGVLGSLIIGIRYGKIQDDVRGLMDNGHDTMDAWSTALDTIKKNWKKAEDSSTAVYQ